MKQRVLSTLLALCMMLALLPPTAQAAQSGGAVGDSKVTWALSDTGVLSIGGSGAMHDYGYYNPGNYPWNYRRAEVKSIVIGGTVTSIGASAFRDCSNATNLTVTSKSLATVARGAFEGCNSLRMISYSGTEAQWNTISVDPSNYAKLYPVGGRVVYNGSPSTTTVASGLVNDEVTWALSSSGTLTIGGSGAMVDYGYYNPGSYPWYTRRGDVKSIVIGGAVTSIGASAFKGCSNAASLTVTSKSLTSILRGAFEGCSIQNFNSSMTVDQWRTVTVDYSNYSYLYPAGGKCTFNGSTAYLAAGKLNDTSFWTLSTSGVLTVVGSGAMADYGYYNPGSYPWYAHRADVKSVVVGGTLTSIAASAFKNCTNLNSLTVTSDKLTSILRGAFEGCGSVTNIYYISSEARWNQINSDASNNKALANGTMHYGYIEAAPKEYTITFNVNGGGTVSPGSIKLITGEAYGAKAFLPVAFRTGYIFTGWYTEAKGGTQVLDTHTFLGVSNQTLYAHWEIDPSSIVTMTVTFNPNKGTVNPSSKEVIKGETYGSLPTPSRTGYKFDGWYTAATGGTKVLSTTKVNKSVNHTLYAHWTSTSSSTGNIKVTLNANGGKVTTSSKNVSKGGTYGTLPTPTRSGFKFNGWYTASLGGTKVISTSKVTKSTAHTLYAHWARQTYQVTFNPNGGTVLRSFNAVVNGSPYGSMPTPTYPGKHFLGWYTASSGGTKVTENTKVTLTSNKTLYAHWSTAAVRASSPTSVSRRVTIPAYYELALYSSTTNANPANYKLYTSDTTLTCTRMSTLSNGTVRYCTNIGGTSYWFTYSDEMIVK